MKRTLRLVVSTLAVAGLIAMVGPVYAKGKGKAHQQHHHSGERLLGNKIKTNGNHVLEKIGKNTVSVVVKSGKVSGVKVKHSQKGDLAVKKYKTDQKMASVDRSTGIQLAQYMGTTYIGYSFIDEYGDEWIEWFPYDMIYDGDMDAVLYVPAD
jgi:hypothetical protein